MIKHLSTIFLVLFGSLLFTSCQNEEKALASSIGKLVATAHSNGLSYQMQYEPHLLKSKKAKQVNNPGRQRLSDAERFRGHHYITMQIDGVNPGLATDHQDNYAILSEYLNEDYKHRFSLIVNGERRPCVLHHALFPPQNPSKVIVQMVFKDPNFSDQENYFQDDITVVYFDKKNREEISWSFSAHELNQFPSLNNNYKNG